MRCCFHGGATTNNIPGIAERCVSYICYSSVLTLLWEQKFRFDVCMVELLLTTYWRNKRLEYQYEAYVTGRRGEDPHCCCTYRCSSSVVTLLWEQKFGLDAFMWIYDMMVLLWEK